MAVNSSLFSSLLTIQSSILGIKHPAKQITKSVHTSKPPAPPQSNQITLHLATRGRLNSFDKMTDQNSIAIKLAPELLSNICSNLDKPGLKLARLVCKALDGAAVHMLFDRVYVASRYADLEVARLVAARFRPFIKTLVYCSESYDDYTLKEFRTRVAGYDCRKHYEIS